MEEINDNKDLQTENSIIKYIDNRLISLSWTLSKLSKQSSISQGEISKIQSGRRKRLKAEVFFKIYKAFGDTCEAATKIVYPSLTLLLNNYSPKERNQFGSFMKQFEVNKNSIEEIAQKTRISENRLKDLYFRIAAPEAHELLLIEKAIGKKQGELFEAIYGEER